MILEIDENTSKLQFFQTLFNEAQTATSELHEKLKRHLDQYKGSKEIDNSPTEAEVVRNITYELIESQVTSYIPNPSVHSKMFSDRKERNAKSIETMLRNKRDELPYEELNDIDERYNPIYGGSIWLVEWDNAITTHNTVGDIKVSCLSPRHFFGQPNIYKIRDMEYCFITFETTKEDIERKYDVSIKLLEETENEEAADDKTATLIVCYYKNEEGKVCQYIWSGDTEIKDIEDYFARKRYVCKKCDKRKEICNCDKGDYELENDEEEIVERDIQRSDGNVISKMSVVIENGQVVTEEVQQPLYQADGTPVFDNSTGVLLPAMTTVLVPKMEQTKLPYYVPNILPVVIRKNTSEEDNLLGQSDCEFIRPQQQAINKVETRIMQKTVRGGVFPLVPDDFSYTLSDSVLETAFKVKQSNAKLYGKLDLQANISQDIAEAERLYDQAKRILGITDSFQGQYDGSAQSGKAKQLQIQQAAGRLDSKRQMKNAAYADMDKIIFQYYLAYADEPRPVAYKDSFGKLQNRTFNRYDFIERDEAGEYYYDDEYLFSTDATIDVERSRELLWQENRQNFQQGAYGDPKLLQTQLIFWQNMEQAHYPWAHDNVERIAEEIARQQEMQALQAQLVQTEQENESNKKELENYGKYAQYIDKFVSGGK